MKKIIGLLSVSLVALNASAPQNAAEEAAQLAAAIEASQVVANEEAQLAAAIEVSKRSFEIEESERREVVSVEVKAESTESGGAVPGIRQNVAVQENQLAKGPVDIDVWKKDGTKAAIEKIAVCSQQDKLILYVGFSGDDHEKRPIYDDKNAFSLGFGPHEGGRDGDGQHICLDWNLAGGGDKHNVSSAMQGLSERLAGSFSCVVIDIWTLEHVRARSAFLKCLASMLRGGGFLYIPEIASGKISFGVHRDLELEGVKKEEMEVAIKRRLAEIDFNRIGDVRCAIGGACMVPGMESLSVPYSQLDACLESEHPAFKVVCQNPQMIIFQGQRSDFRFVKYIKPGN